MFSCFLYLKPNIGFIFYALLYTHRIKFAVSKKKRLLPIMRYSIAVKGEGINKKKDVCVCIQDSVSNMRK